MLIWWIASAVGTLLAGVAALVVWKKPKYRRKVAAARKRLNRRTGNVTRSAWRAHRSARDRTPRGQRRLRRQAEPHRLTWGHRRTEDDPTRSRRAARWAGQRTRTGTGRLVEKARLARMNRRPKPKRRVLELTAHKVANGPGAKPKKAAVRREYQHTCNAKNADGTGCMNAQTRNGTGACWIPSHVRQLQGHRRAG